ncbi:hypothetical protein ACQ4PT_001716 [Festuca glaucescens]
MEAAAVACRGGGALARPLTGHRARRHGVGPARRRFLVVASLEEAPSAPARNAVAVAQEIAQFDEHEYVAASAILPPPDDLVNTVQVKFVLQKQCAFGQRFLVVGDDPALGLWDPTKAAALEWSEDHVWTARMDLPANRAIEFKFLLQDPSGQADKGLTDVVGTDGGSSPRREKMGANEANRPRFTLEKDQKVPDVLRRRASMAGQNGHLAAGYAGRNGDSTLYEEGAPVENRPASMFENDMDWVRKALQRLLRSIGLQIGTTKT